MLGDGTAGLKSVKSEGGKAIVQDPKEAEFGSMPLRAIRAVSVDFVLPAAEIGQKLLELVREPWKHTVPIRAKNLA